MAWQSSAAMMGNGGGPGGGEGSSQGSQSQGTEYTLQGVMRFLQTEWHRHERDRNAWEIERAEMKNRIAKLEGEGRTSKRMQDSLGKHIKLLETALRKEREKVRKLQSGQQIDDQKPDAQEVKDFANSEYAAPLSKGSNAVDSIGAQAAQGVELNSKIVNGDAPYIELRQDPEREKSRHYLQKCLQELTYHTLSNQLAAEEAESIAHEHSFGGQHMSQPSIESYLQQQRARQANSAGHVAALANHQSAGASRHSEAQGGRNAARMEESMNKSSVAFDHQRDTMQRSAEDASISEEPVENISHSYDAYGQPVAPREEQGVVRSGQAAEVTDQGDWNFDEAKTTQQEQASPPEYSATQRPDQEAFPAADGMSLRNAPNGPNVHKRKTSLSKRRTSDGAHEGRELSLAQHTTSASGDSTFKVRFALRGHVDVVRSVIFTGGGSPSEPEICTTGDDGVIKRWTIPANYGAFTPHTSTSAASDLDVSSYFTHRGHSGPVMCLAAAPASQHVLNGGRAQGDGWVFSGGADRSVRVWERGRVDPKATLEGHTDAVWSICVLPGTAGTILGDQCSQHGGSDRIVIASGAADGSVMIWAVSSPPQLTSPSTAGSRRGGRRANSVSSGSQFPSSPQATTATNTPFHHSLIHRIERPDSQSPTCIVPLSPLGLNFVVGYNDASVVIFDTRTGEEIVGMVSQETYDNTVGTGVNAIAATSLGTALGGASLTSSSPSSSDHSKEDELRSATGTSNGVEGIVLSGHEDKYIRFYDANSGQCTYNMIAHQSAISALSLSPDSLELVSAGHDASLRFWSLEKRTCTQEITSHRPMRGEGVCAVVWSADGRWVVSGGGDGVIKVFSR